MPLWNLEGHVKLPPNVTGPLLVEEAEQAEMLLGLRGHTVGEFDAVQVRDLKRALCLQIALQTEQDPEAFLAESVGRAGEDIDYRDGVVVHPAAAAIVERVLEEIAPAEPEGTAGEFVIVPGLRGGP